MIVIIVPGSPIILSLLFDKNSTTLRCTSTGGPPTTVTWRKNGVPVNTSLYEQSQRLVDAERATYESLLFNEDVTVFVDIFTCEISNARGVVQESAELNGQLIDLRTHVLLFIHCFVFLQVSS